MGARVVTLNCEGLAHGWYDGRRDALVRGLQALRPDILCLQEVTVCHRDDRLYDQAHDISEAVGLEFVAFDTYGEPDEVRADRQDGLAIASRWPFRRMRDRRLPVAEHDSADGRVVLLCRLMTPDGDVDVVTTHLAWRPQDQETRRIQADIILDVFVREGFGQDGHVGVLAGDLNATEDEPVIRRIGKNLRDAWRVVHPDEPGHTWLKQNPYTEGWDMPDRRLDYVFVPPTVQVRRAQIVLDRADPVWPSDHCGVLVDLDW